MEYILIVLAIILGGLLGWLLKQTFNTPQPWVAEPVGDSAHLGPMDGNSKLIGLITLLAVVTSFFALIVSAYTLRMDLGDWIPLTEPQLLWANTGILAVASFAFQWTRNAAVRGDESKLLPGMIVTGLLTSAFVVGQFIAWQQLNASGQYVSVNPANGFFFFLTGAHAVHILGGMYVWTRATVRLMSGKNTESVRRSIELCAVYWHFLLIVWLVLFGLLLST